MSACVVCCDIVHAEVTKMVVEMWHVLRILVSLMMML